MEEARKLDGQDRYLNWKAARYFMRAGDVDRGIDLLGLFTKVFGKICYPYKYLIEYCRKMHLVLELTWRTCSV